MADPRGRGKDSRRSRRSDPSGRPARSATPGRQSGRTARASGSTRRTAAGAARGAKAKAKPTRTRRGAGGGPPTARAAQRSGPPRGPGRGGRTGPKIGHPHRRMRFMLMAVLIVFSLFAAQLLRLQAIDAKTMAEAALGHRLQSETLPALRGDITDTKGVVLADSEERRDITADPTAVAQYTKIVDGKRTEVGIAGAAEDLAPLLGKTAHNLEIRLRANPGTRFTYLVKGVSPLTWRKVAALGIPGVLSERTTERDYPTGGMAASLVGWVGADGKAGGGIEQLLDKQLTGKPGKMTYERSGDGSVIATGEHTDVPAVPGRDVRLTIDSDLQFMAYNTIAQAVTKSRSLSGTVVVENRKGDLLAVASYPSFDPNDIGAAKGYLGNRAFTEVFEPGSTAKVMTAAAALEEGVATPRTHVTVPPTLERAGSEFRDAEKHGTLHLTFAGVLAHSSNMGAILVGEKMSKQTMYDYLRKFGVGRPTGVGFPGESPGLLAKPGTWNGTQRFTILYGQGMSVNAIQDAGVLQAIANGGVRVPPRLVRGTSDADGNFTKNPRAKPVRVVSPKTAQGVTDMLEGVVGAHGTAPAARVKGYRVAGKTGTASRYDPELGRYNGYTASFIGFAPADDPQLIVSVSLQRPRSSIYGGVVAAPVFSTVMTYALQAGKIPPTGTTPHPVPLTFSTPADQSRARATGKNE